MLVWSLEVNSDRLKGKGKEGTGLESVLLGSRPYPDSISQIHYLGLSADYTIIAIALERYQVQLFISFAETDSFFERRFANIFIVKYTNTFPRIMLRATHPNTRRNRRDGMDDMSCVSKCRDHNPPPMCFLFMRQQQMHRYR